MERAPGRRRFLAGLGGASLAAVAGCSGTDGDDRATPRDLPGLDPSVAAGFGAVVDMGDATVAASGRTPVDALLAERVADDTLLYFPEGRYLLGDSVSLRGVSNAGIVGDGATIVPPDGYTGYMLVVGEASGFHLEGVTFDVTAPDTGPHPLQVQVADDLVVRDVAVRGRLDTGQDVMRFDVTDPEGTGLVEGLRLPDGAAAETPAYGVLVSPQSRGELVFRDCHVEGFPNNGLYASPATGPVRVEGGYYANNGIASVRVGDDATVRDVHVRCDRSPREFENMRGIRLRNGDDTVVENCLVEVLDVTASDGGVVAAPWLGSATVRDTRIRVDADGVAGVRVKPRRRGATDGDAPPLHCENVAVTGSAAGGAAVEVVERDDCVFDGLCVRGSGAGRDGVEVVGATGTALRDVRVAVPGEAVALRDADLAVRDVSTAPVGDAPRCGR